MTCDEARRRAVEAAIDAWNYADTDHSDSAPDPIEAAISAYERAMADAGWRMVRVPDEAQRTAEYVAGGNSVECYMAGHNDGWNACRAAMLEDE